MGGIESREAIRFIPEREAFAHWTPSDVLAAWEKARALRPSCAPPQPVGAPAPGAAGGAPSERFNGGNSIRLNRREWLEVFTDLGDIREGQRGDAGGFLHLPLSYFEALRPWGDDRVEALDVLLAACLCCNAPKARDRAAVAFKVFDLE